MKSLWSCPSRSLIGLYSNCQVWASSYIGLYKNEIISNNLIQKIGLEKEDEELTLLNSQQYIFFLNETEYSWPSKSMVPHPWFQPTTVVFEVAILSLAVQFMLTIESQPQWHRLTAWVRIAGIFLVDMRPVGSFASPDVPNIYNAVVCLSPAGEEWGLSGEVTRASPFLDRSCSTPHRLSMQVCVCLSEWMSEACMLTWTWDWKATTPKPSGVQFLSGDIISQ